MPQFEFVFEDDVAPKPAPAPKSKPTPAASFGAEPEPYNPLPLTQLQEEALEAERVWSAAHEEWCMYTRYTTPPPELWTQIERLFQNAQRLALQTHDA